MKIKNSYKQILAISTPIMLASAVQNVIALSDSVFLYHKSELDFAAIAFVSVFYLTIAAIGYGFSRAGQIIIARRAGEGNLPEVGRTFYAMVYFELALAAIMFTFMQFGSPWFFAAFVNDPEIYNRSLEYINYRSYGVFFSYVGVAIVALYTGVARTTFIMIDTLILAMVNIFLNYCLIFGKCGLPEMGIGGAGLASTIAEIVAFVLFVIYILYDKKSREYNLFKFPKIDVPLIKKQLSLASPIVAQAVVGLGSWVVFFGLVDNLGQRPLAISNLVRNVYLILSIPTWGFASGVNTMVSNLIGQGKRGEVLPVTKMTAKLSLLVTMMISIPVVFFPEFFLYPIFGKGDMTMIQEAQPVFYVLLGIMGLFAVSGIYFNSLVGTGATLYALKMQMICAVLYLVYITISIKYVYVGLEWAWAGELFYWVFIWITTIVYLGTEKWHGVKV